MTGSCLKGAGINHIDQVRELTPFSIPGCRVVRVGVLIIDELASNCIEERK
jgi:hypothetical protein